MRSSPKTFPGAVSSEIDPAGVGKSKRAYGADHQGLGSRRRHGWGEEGTAGVIKADQATVESGIQEGGK